MRVHKNLKTSWQRRSSILVGCTSFLFFFSSHYWADKSIKRHIFALLCGASVGNLFFFLNRYFFVNYLLLDICHFCGEVGQHCQLVSFRPISSEVRKFARLVQPRVKQKLVSSIIKLRSFDVQCIRTWRSPTSRWIPPRAVRASRYIFLSFFRSVCCRVKFKGDALMLGNPFIVSAQSRVFDQFAKQERGI